MFQNILLDLWPWAVALALVVGALATLARSLRPQIRRAVFARLHRDQVGGVQSVSFVLTAPIFVMLMLLAVQITQLMIGLMVVHYSAFAAIRSASVWIPARLEPVAEVGENRIGQRTFIAPYVPGGVEYEIEPGSIKFERIRQAAALACVPIAPSRDLGGGAAGDATTGSLQSMYAALAPSAMSNTRIPQRLANKWAYANAATTVEMRVFHPDFIEVDAEPPLMQYWPFAAESEFTPTEIGWRDQVRITVTHNFALLPGPGRLLARRANEQRYPDRVSPRVQEQAGVHYIPLRATATLVPEGEKSVIPYVQQIP
jgi:hypothetical protein